MHLLHSIGRGFLAIGKRCGQPYSKSVPDTAGDCTAGVGFERAVSNALAGASVARAAQFDSPFARN